MPGTKRLKLRVRDLVLAHVLERQFRVVLADDHEDLEHLPPERLQAGELRVHVFSPVQLADDGVELEADVELAAPERDVEELADLLAGAAADGDVGLLVEGVAGYGENVDTGGVLAQESLGDAGAVGDDRHGLQLQVVLAVVEHYTKESRVQKGFTAGEVDFLHARFGEEGKPALGVGDVASVRGGCRVKAEAAAIVALATEVIVDGDGAVLLGFDVEEFAVKKIGGQRNGEGEQQTESEESHGRFDREVSGWNEGREISVLEAST